MPNLVSAAASASCAQGHRHVSARGRHMSMWERAFARGRSRLPGFERPRAGARVRPRRNDLRGPVALCETRNCLIAIIRKLTIFYNRFLRFFNEIRAYSFFDDFFTKSESRSRAEVLFDDF
jgi:hypothetical protein